MGSIIQSLWHLPRRIAILAIRGYQYTLSPDHGALKGLYPYGYCRHDPTCSQYAKQTLASRGFVMGSLLTARRLMTCHPWRKPRKEKMLKFLS